MFTALQGKPKIGVMGFDLGFGLLVARTLSCYLKTKYQSLTLDCTLNTPPNDPELLKLLTSLKANKAAGHYDPSPSVLGLVRVIGLLIRRIWEECVFPEEWGLSDVLCLYRFSPLSSAATCICVLVESDISPRLV